MKVYVLAPIHNRKYITLKFLGSFAKQTHESYQVIVIDDGSTDGSSEASKEKFPDTIILKGDGNLWWTGAMRKGIEYILSIAESNDYILAINDDVVVKENYIENLVKASRQNNNAIVGSIYMDEDDNEIVYDGGVKIDWLTYKYYHPPFSKGDGIISNIDTLATRGTLIPMEVFKKIGSFERRLRHYAADYEYFLRARHFGFKLIISRDAIVYGSEKDRIISSNSYIQSFSKIWNKNFSIKSSTNIYNHLFIIWKYCPSLFYKIKHSFLIISYNCFLFTNSILLYPIKELATKIVKSIKSDV